MTQQAQIGEAKFFMVLSRASKARFYAAVFCIFSVFGVLWDIGSPMSQPWYMIIIWMIFSGGIAVLYAHTFTHNLKLLFVAIPLSVAIPLALQFIDRSAHLSTLIPGSGQVYHMLAILVLVVLGYILFVSFINGEGSRSFRLQNEIALAEGIHSELVPPIDRHTASVAIRGMCDPSSEVGGDLLDTVIDGERVRLCVADVSGHGVQAGLLMAMVKSALRMRLMTDDDLNELIDDLNHVLVQINLTAMFTTAAFMRFDGTNTAQYALAGHPPILHYRAKSKTVNYIESDFPPLGILNIIDYQASTVEFESGDLFVILTDGIVEVFDSGGEDFGQERIADIVVKTAHRPLSEIESAIISGVREFGQQEDDQTLLLVRAL